MSIIPNNDSMVADCAPDSDSKGQKGVTYYRSTSNPYLSPNGGTWTASWTGTKPKGYRDGSVCNLSFDVLISEDAMADDVKVECILNGDTVNYIGPIYHSRVQGHDITHIIDISQYGAYNDGGANSLKFTNKSNVGVWINNLRIMREYAMWNLPDSIKQGPGVFPPASGVLDGGRNDCPCNYDRPVVGTRGGLSVNTWPSYNGAGSLVPYGSTLTWIFKNPGYSSGQSPNYVSPAACFFNFNNVDLTANAPGSDVAFQINLNGQSIATMYNSRIRGHTSAAGIDLVKFSGYKDYPNAINTVQLTNKTPATTLVLKDGENENAAGRINIYRVYNVTKF